MRKLLPILVVTLAITLAFTGGHASETKLQAITKDNFIERSQDIMLLGQPYTDTTEDVIIVLVIKKLDGWQVNQTDVYMITQNTHEAHPTILKVTTISDLESGRSWEKREAWSAAEAVVVEEWLKK